MLKTNVNDFDEKLKTVISSYNDTLNTGIGCTPNEAYCDISEKARIENSVDSKYRKLFKERKKEKFFIGQKVGYSKRENLGSKNKMYKGRFIYQGKVVATLNEDNYL
ncbi:hypothetical protein COBT_003887, partial [Conglomerata obtusa]